MTFINREKELNFLEKKWKERTSQFIVIYGKKRVGKTELIKQFIKNKPAVYFLADKRSTLEQLRELTRLISFQFKDRFLEKQGFKEWLDVFLYLKERVRKPFVLVVDEYPYLVETDKTITSIFQKGWDEYLKKTRVFLILCGSSVSMMESETLIYKSPLYGRRTGQILLKPLSFYESWKFFPEKKFEEFLSIFTLCGGIPAYLLKIDPKLSLEENIKEKIFPKTEFLHNEIEFILKEELREPKNYFSILKAIAFGKRKFGEIINETGLERSVLTKYLDTLENLQLIEKEVPITERRPEKSRKGLYQLTDNFFRFWFQYIFPYKSDLELERFKEPLHKIRQTFHLLESFTYEKIAQEILWSFSDKIFSFERIGRWWEREKEIDLVGLNSQTKEIIFGEVKYSSRPVGLKVFLELKKKSQFVNWCPSKRKEYFIIFSKSGFSSQLKKIAKKEKVFLVHKDKLIT